MKLTQKTLLLTSLLVIGTGVTSIPALTDTVQAATTTSYKNLTPQGFYYRLSKDEFVKASDIKILTKDTQTDDSMIETASPNDFRLETTTTAHIYNQKGQKLSKTLSQGTVCSIGSQDAFTQSTYYKTSADKLTQVNDSTWL
ncbi:SLAP domain-containing protein [Companilactobacillus nantensis]|uniref:S-layer protein C-terminal domain-containing protein n=1 Tax=Companilactobacillus nantensis DSM 16982 TaxID=1423774 RepID=A0A0R1WDQ1_9LACO|nr:SLAP domain-containing protein [Companilactobacillus nantensis]KRM16050.1 hypothetical protein FD31_GL000725 [Companilactobacillus nantensis DSM 16982]GEO63837.1 hypothetical protein LNA01_10200 [Companilactobacillus nantensis]